jgi:hypothetical protein
MASLQAMPQANVVFDPSSKHVDDAGISVFRLFNDEKLSNDQPPIVVPVDGEAVDTQVFTQVLVAHADYVHMKETSFAFAQHVESAEEASSCGLPWSEREGAYIYAAWQIGAGSDDDTLLNVCKLAALLGVGRVVVASQPAVVWVNYKDNFARFINKKFGEVDVSRYDRADPEPIPRAVA